jgi:hypothetical protein
MRGFFPVHLAFRNLPLYPQAVPGKESIMFKSCAIAIVLLLTLGVSAPLVTAAHAANFGLIELAQEDSNYPIRPSEAALIAKDANPDAKVLGVKLLPSGVYAVTLKIGGSISRVLVDATSGAIS